MSTELNAKTPAWNELEGRVLDGRYVLEKCRFTAANLAVFGTKSIGQEQNLGVLKAIALEPGEAAKQLESWQAVQKLRHPNLIRLLHAGSTEIESIPVVYAVMEPTDEMLEAVLKDRGLQKDEAEQIAGSAVNALEYVHSNGFVHAGVEPRNIFAVGETIKIASDCIQLPGEPHRKIPDGYQAPEVAASGLSAASDFWALGATLFEVLTQRAPAAGAPVDAAGLPKPFAEIVAGCLEPDVASRWNARQVRTALHPDPSPMAASVLPERPEVKRPLAPLNSVSPHGITARQAIHKSPTWIYAILLLIAVFGIAWYLISRPSVPKNSAPVKTAARQHITPTPESPHAAAPSGTQAPVASAQSRVASPTGATARPAPPNAMSDWRVVIYTYAREADARQRAHIINSKQPGLQAEVFSPSGGDSPYLVAIGGWMDRESANRLRQRAIKSGLPRDTYTQNFRK
jgi:serine/threonine protein kinase